MRRLLPQVLDYLYPPACHLCQLSLDEGHYLCPACEHDSTRLNPPFCQVCSEGFDGAIKPGFTCPNCHDQDYHFQFARSALANTSSNHQLIHDFKYLKQLHLGKELARFCAEIFQVDARFNNLPAPVLVPVPLHWRRKLSRGYNQAEELCRQLSKLTGLPSHAALSRYRYTSSQTRLGRNKRQQNLKGAFKARSLPRHFRSAILVDDVFTTGSTANACARTLKKHAPQLENIVVLTVLRG